MSISLSDRSSGRLVRKERCVAWVTGERLRWPGALEGPERPCALASTSAPSRVPMRLGSQGSPAPRARLIRRSGMRRNVGSPAGARGSKPLRPQGPPPASPARVTPPQARVSLTRRSRKTPGGFRNRRLSARCQFDFGMQRPLSLLRGSISPRYWQQRENRSKGGQAKRGQIPMLYGDT